ncbi:4818_t:CDS:2, partial [Ambispora leptoticha]
SAFQNIERLLCGTSVNHPCCDDRAPSGSAEPSEDKRKRVSTIFALSQVKDFSSTLKSLRKELSQLELNRMDIGRKVLARVRSSLSLNKALRATNFANTTITPENAIPPGEAKKKTLGISLHSRKLFFREPDTVTASITEPSSEDNPEITPYTAKPQHRNGERTLPAGLLAERSGLLFACMAHNTRNAAANIALSGASVILAADRQPLPPFRRNANHTRYNLANGLLSVVTPESVPREYGICWWYMIQSVKSNNM